MMKEPFPKTANMRSRTKRDIMSPAHALDPYIHEVVIYVQEKILVGEC